MRLTTYIFKKNFCCVCVCYMHKCVHARMCARVVCAFVGDETQDFKQTRCKLSHSHSPASFPSLIPAPLIPCWDLGIGLGDHQDLWWSSTSCNAYFTLLPHLQKGLEARMQGDRWVPRHFHCCPGSLSETLTQHKASACCDCRPFAILPWGLLVCPTQSQGGSRTHSPKGHLSRQQENSSKSLPKGQAPLWQPTQKQKAGTVQVIPCAPHRDTACHMRARIYFCVGNPKILLFLEGAQTGLKSDVPCFQGTVQAKQWNCVSVKLPFQPYYRRLSSWKANTA